LHLAVLPASRSLDVSFTARRLLIMTKSDSTNDSDTPAFLASDARVPAPVRDLIAEAEGCMTNGYLTGGTACAQRAIQLLVTAEKVDGPDIEARVKGLAEKYPAVPQMLTAVLQRFGDATSRDGAKLSAAGLNLLIVTLKAILYEIYVLGPERAERLEYVRRVFDSIERKSGDKRSGASAGADAAPIAATA
jgi:hypothetical protein